MYDTFTFTLREEHTEGIRGQGAEEDIETQGSGSNRGWSKLYMNQLHGAESFLRSYEVLSQSRNPQHFVEPEGSLPHPQMPATCSNPKPDQSSACFVIPFPEDPV